eukprot:2458077-Prymnesium_polylepis.1
MRCAQHEAAIAHELDAGRAGQVDGASLVRLGVGVVVAERLALLVQHPEPLCLQAKPRAALSEPAFQLCHLPTEAAPHAVIIA